MKILILGFVSMFFLSGCDSSNNTIVDKNTSIENILKTELLISNKSGYGVSEFGTFNQEKIVEFLTTPSQYAEESIKYDPNNSIGNLDFTKGNVLLIDMGQRGNSGLTIRTKVIETDSLLLVNIEYCYSFIVSTIVSHPYQLVWIPSKKETELIEKNINLEGQTCK